MTAEPRPGLRRFSTNVAALAGRLGVDRLRDTGLGARVFEHAYWIYKARFEAPEARALMPYTPAGTAAIDVGANLGFFTRLFVERTQCSVVVAVEPEARNIESLKRGAARWGRDRVTIVEAAVADVNGTVNLRIDAKNHADHQLADEGLPVRAVRLDDLREELQLGRVGVIKIDVQGAEERVLRGSVETIRRDHPVLYVELDPDRLMAQGSSPTAVLSLLEREGYRFARLEKAATIACEPAEVLRAMEADSYVDVLCLPLEA